MRALLLLGAFAAVLAACSEESSNPSDRLRTALAGTNAEVVTPRGVESSVATSSPASSPTARPSGRCAPPPGIDPAVADVFCTATAGMERASVVRIIDGDTLEVSVDGRLEDVRVFGIDAAERGERCFAEASSALQQLAGESVLMRPDVRDRDRFGRLLRYLYAPDGLSIDAVLVADGLAEAWRDDGALRDALVALEARARADRRGCLWSAP